jgi:hypothetical protein
MTRQSVVIDSSLAIFDQYAASSAANDGNRLRAIIEWYQIRTNLRLTNMAVPCTYSIYGNLMRQGVVAPVIVTALLHMPAASCP